MLNGFVKALSVRSSGKLTKSRRFADNSPFASSYPDRR